MIGVNKIAARRGCVRESLRATARSIAKMAYHTSDAIMQARNVRICPA